MIVRNKAFLLSFVLGLFFLDSDSLARVDVMDEVTRKPFISILCGLGNNQTKASAIVSEKDGYQLAISVASFPKKFYQATRFKASRHQFVFEGFGIYGDLQSYIHVQVADPNKDDTLTGYVHVKDAEGEWFQMGACKFKRRPKKDIDFSNLTE